MRKRIIIFISLLALATLTLVSCGGNIPTRQQAVDTAMSSQKSDSSSADALIHAAQINADAITAAAQINADAITAAAEMIAAAQGNQSIVVNAGTGAASGETTAPMPATCSVKAVNLMGAWVDAGASETDAFSFTDENGVVCESNFDEAILPLFTEANMWFDGSAACASCHFASSATSAHEMDLTSYAGIMAGADTLSKPPGVPILEPSNWNSSALRGRLRNNRMPPGWEFDITQINRNGPCVEPGADGMAPVKDADGNFTYGCDATAVGLLGAWVDTGASETDAFSYAGNDGLTFDKDVLPFFTQSNMYFDGSAACSSCHFANSDTSAHEMDLSTYEGIMTGADALSEPPGVSILGQQADGTFNWGSSKLRERLRNNRMPPGWQFDITEANRNGPLIGIGHAKDGAAMSDAMPATPTTCSVKAVNLMGAWVDAGASETDTFSFTDENGATCNGTFNADILPLFTASNVWFDGSAACSSCHFASSATSAHEMDLTSYAGIMAGADTLSEPPGVPILEPSNWNGSALRGRMRNNRMPPGWEFDITTTNRNGPCVEPGADGMAPVKDADGKFTYGCDATAVGLLGAWADAGASETDAFSYAGNDGLTFDKDVLPFFTQSNMYFDGSAACSSCHFANSDTSAHEMDLTSYAGIMIGADSLSKPPGVSILGKQADGTFDWGSSKLRGRLRNNRMSPGWEFDITEGNRNGPLIEAGSMK